MKLGNYMHLRFVSRMLPQHQNQEASTLSLLGARHEYYLNIVSYKFQNIYKIRYILHMNHAARRESGAGKKRGKEINVDVGKRSKGNIVKEKKKK